MPLADTEKLFVQCLSQPDVDDEVFLSRLSALDSLTEEKQLFIYRSNVNGAYQKVLGQVYPACLNILGEEYFNQLGRAYRFDYPSTSADLNCYGEFFPIFLTEQVNQHRELNDFEYLPGLAELEWHWHKSFYAKNNEVFGFEKLMSVDPEFHNRLVFTLADSFSLHSTPYPLLEIWQGNKDKQSSSEAFIMPESESYFCIFRADFVPEITVLTANEFTLLKLLSAGASLSVLTEANGDAAAFQQQLIRFIEKKWITGFLLQDRANMV